MIRTSMLLLTGVVALALVGCGGSLGDPSGLLSATVTSTINWLPDQSLQSAKLILVDKNGTAYSIIVHPSDPQPYKIADAVPVGQANFTANFFTSTDGSGTPVSTVNVPVNVQAPTTNVPVSVKPPAKIQLVSPQTVTVGQQTALVAIVTDADGNFAAVNVNSIVLTSSSPTVLQTASQGLLVTGQKSGGVTVQANLGALVSNTATVNVVTGIAVSITPASDKLLTLNVGQAHTFHAIVSPATASQAVVWSVAEGPAGGTIDQSGNYIAPGSPGTYRVVATSSADSSATDVAIVTVQSGNANVNVH